jgi:hypothetical protein
MIDPKVRRRLEQDLAFQSERVRNLLHAAYQDPDRAWARWQAGIEGRGPEAFSTRLLNKPTLLGRHKGRLWFNFWKDAEYQNSLRAHAELVRLARPWHAAVMQVTQIKAREQAEKDQTEKAADIRAQWQEQRQERDQARAARDREQEGKDSPER